MPLQKCATMQSYCTVRHNILKSQVVALSKFLSPQKFVKMAGQRSCVDTVHSFEMTFAVLPHTFHMICCASSLRIDKIAAMVDYVVYIGRIDIKCCNSIIRCPLVGVNDTTRFDIALNCGTARIKIPLLWRKARGISRCCYLTHEFTQPHGENRCAFHFMSD